MGSREDGRQWDVRPDILRRARWERFVIAARLEVARTSKPVWRVVWQRVSDGVLSTDPKRQIRVAQWMISAAVYFASATVLALGVGQGWLDQSAFLAWCAFLFAGQSVAYVVAIRDELTGLLNRRHMQERLEHEESRFLRSGQPFSIAVIDLDHFKEVNDTYGHAGGDEVLRVFAVAASEAIRNSDLLARWGGEEFLLLMPETRAPQAHAGVERLLSRIRALTTPSGVRLSFSAGATEHCTGDMLSDTIVRADREMYAAKKAGRNRVLLK